MPAFLRQLHPLAGVVVFAMTAGSAAATALTWNGLAGDNNILNGVNWNTGTAPAASGDALIFTGGTSLLPTLASNRSVASITFNSGASSFSLAGLGVYTLSTSGGLANASSLTQTIGNSLLLGINQTWSSNLGNLVLNGNIDNNAKTLTISSTGTTTLNGVLSGSGAFNKSGTGTLILNGTNTYSGLTNLTGGNVVLGNGAAFGSSAVKFNSTALVISTAVGGATVSNAYTFSRNFTFAGSNNLTLTGNSTLGGNRSVTVNGTGVVTLSGVISGNSRTLTKAGSGTLILSNSNTMRGVKLTAGTLYATNANALSSGTFTLGTGSFGTTSSLAFANVLSLAGNTTFVGSDAITFNGTAALTATRSLTFNDTAPVTFNGVISGSTFGINKSGTGTFVIGGTGANTFNGIFKVNEGQVSLGKTAGVSAFAGALEIGDSSGTAASALVQLTASNQIPDASAVTIFSDGQLRLQTFSETIGALTLTGGSVTGTGPLTLGGDVTFNGSSGLTSSISSLVALAANRTFLVNSSSLSGADLLITGNISGTFSATKAGAGTLSLSGANGFSGGYFANAGTTLIGSSTALGTAAVNLGDTSGSNSASLLFDTATSLTVSNGITVRSGNTGISKLGGLNTSGTNTFGGTLTLNNSVTFSAEAGGEVAFTGTISGAGGFNKIGAGTLRLSGSNSSSGAMLISAGTLALGASNALGLGALTVDGGTLSLGANSDSVGTVILDNGGSITGSSTLTSTGNFDLRSGSIQVALAGSGNLTKSTSGTITLSGASTFSGTTTVSAGTLTLGVANALPTATAATISSGAILNLNGYATQMGSLAGAGDVQLGTATLTTGSANTSTTFSGVMSGTGGLTKTGSATLTVSGANSFSGATAVSAGTLLLGAGNSLNSTTALTANGTFNLGSFSQSVGSLSGAGTVTLGGGTFTIGGANTSTSFSGAIGGSGNLVKSGTGTLTLSGTNSTTAATKVSGGTLTLNGAAGSLASASSFTLDSGTILQLDNSTTENNNRIGNNAAIRLNGGAFQLISDATGTSETVGALNVLGGSSTVNVTHNGGASTPSALTFSSFGTVTNGATVNFTASGGTLGASILGPQLYITGQANGLLGGWATVGADPAEMFLYGIRAFSSYYEGALGINIDDTTKIVRLSSSSPSGATTLTNAGITTDLGLNLTDVGTVDLGSSSSRSLNLSSGSLIKSTALLSTIQGAGNLTAGGTAAGNLNVSVTSGSSLIINSVIANNASAAIGLTKGDSGTLTLGAANTFTGNVFVNDGVLSISAENNLGTGSKDVIFNGGTLKVTSGYTASSSKLLKVASGLSGTLEVASGQTLTLADSAGMLATGDASSVFINQGLGSLIIPNANFGFLGYLRISQGTVELRNAASLGSGTVQLNGGTLSLSQNSSTAFNNNVAMQADSSIRVSRLSGSGSVTHSLGNLDLGSRTLTVTGDGSAALAFSSITLSGNGTLNPTSADLRAGAIGGAYDLTKTGAAALILTAASNYTGSTIITNGILRLAAANLVPDASALSLASGTSFDSVSFSETIGSLTGFGNITLGAGTLTTGGAGSSTFSGIISGSGGLTKAGSSTFTLAGANTFTGATQINAGTLAISASNSLSASSSLTIASGAIFQLNNNSTTLASLTGAGTIALGSGTLSSGASSSSFSGAITGTGGLVKSGAGTLTLSGTSTFSGSTSIQGGGVVMDSSSALGGGSVAVSSGAVLSLENNISVGSKALSLSGNGVFNGGALVNISGNNSWSGTVTLGAASTITATGGSLFLSGTTDLGANALIVKGSGTTTFSGVLSGSGAANVTALNNNGAGTLVLSGSNIYTGLTTVSQGILQVNNATALGATGSGNGTTVASGATLLIQAASGLTIGNEALTLNGSGFGGNGALRSQSGDNIWTGDIALASDSTLRVDAGTLQLNGSLGDIAGTRSITKEGSGTLILSGPVLNNGPILIQSGALQLATANRISDASQVNVSSGATFDLDNNDETIGSLTGAGSVTLGTDIDIGGGDLTSGGDNGSATFSGVISGLGSLNKIGPGTQILSGFNSYTGATTVSDGTLTVNQDASLGATTTTVASGAILRNNGTIAGAITNNGTLMGSGTFNGAVVMNTTDSPGNSIGIQTFTNGLRYTSTSAYYWELASNTASLGLAGTDYDQVRETSGVLQVDAGASLNLVFDMVSSGVNFANVFWTTDHTWSVATISGTATADPGNAAFSLGSISQDAFGHSYSSYGSFTTSTSGGNQQLTWISAVPEPGVTAIGAIGALALLRRRREEKAPQDVIG